MFKKKIKQFIYASSGSVYGVKKEKKVTEKLSLEPISVYNKTKMAAEKIALSYEKKMRIHIIRPATVCGYSDRLRLDLTINMLTYQAMTGKIKIFGGKQIRPNIHINDLVNLYIFFLKNSKKIPSGYYNAGFENYSINQIVKVIRKKIPCLIQKYKSNDIRSYRLDSSKILSLGFKKKFYVSDAINEIKNLFNKIKKKESILNYNIKTMKMLKL